MIGNNPALNEDTFSIPVDELDDNRDVMTLGSTVFKSLTLVGMCIVAATITWGLTTKGGTFDMAVAMPWVLGGAIGGLILALITIFKPKAAPVTAPMYAIAEGLFLGAISAMYEASFGTANGQAGPFSGIVVQAIALTMAVTLVMLTLYGTRVIRVTEKLRAGIIAATAAVFLVYIASFVLSFFSITIPYLHSSGPIGIGISLVIVGIAAFNLLLDFDLIEKGVQTRAPKYMEWYAGFALLVTLVWLYLEILRLLSKLRRTAVPLHSPHMRALSRQFLITFAAMGAILAYLPVLLKQRLTEPIDLLGMTLGSSAQVGLILSTTGLAIILTPVVMTALADTRLQSRSILAVLFSVSALTCTWQALSHDFTSLFISHTVFAFFFWPLAALQDGLVFAANQQASSAGKAETPYHRVRTYGTVGFAIPLAGLYFLIGPGEGKDVSIALWLGVGICVLGMVNALTLPRVQLGQARRARFREPAPSDNKLSRLPTFAAARVLFRGPALLFCLCLFLAHIGNSAYYGFYSIYLTDTVGFAENWVGPITMLGVVLELGVMTTVGLMTARFGLKRLIVFGLGVMALRFALLGALPNQHVAVWTQVLHGITVVAIYVVPPIYLNALAGDHFRSSIQGLYAMTVFGPSRIIGNILGGELADQSLPTMFIVFACSTLLAVIGLAVFMRLPGEIKGDARDVPPMVEGD
eukprot:g12208.t1